MPIVKISLLKIWNAEQKKAMSDHIHEALVEAFKIPDYDYNHQIFEFDNGNLIHSKNKSEKFTLIEMSIFPGRSKEAKKSLYGKIVGRLGGMGIPANDIVIILNEQPLENWGLGATPGDEANIGFNLKV